VATLQGSLFAAGPAPGEAAAGGDAAGPRPLGEALERTELGGGAWVEVRRSWLPGAGDLLERLLVAVAWRAERRPMYERVVAVPRLQAVSGEGRGLGDLVLGAGRQALDRHYGGLLGEPFATAGLCLYRDGRDSVAWHGDTIGRGATEDTVVAILSLGGPRTLLLRPRGGGRAFRFGPSSGDLLVMGGTCQRTWEHAVPKIRRPVGPRVSVQFRPRGVR
jgi:alkylated DNA repair dioxygenase AlkB